MKRQVQTAADASALAAARTGRDWPIDVVRETAHLNGVDVFDGSGGHLSLCGEPNTDGHCNKKRYEVEISRSAPLILSALWLDAPPTVRARAVAVQLPCKGGTGTNGANRQAQRDLGLTGDETTDNGPAGSKVTPANAEDQGHENANEGKSEDENERNGQGGPDTGCQDDVRVRLVQ